jgi:hypothetical protein
MEKQSKVLRKFIKNVNNISNNVLLKYNENIWNKYKNFFNIDDNGIFSLYQSVEDALKYKKSDIYNMYVRKMYPCAYIIENNITDNEIYDIISNINNFYIDNYTEDEYIRDIEFFLDWLIRLSKCKDINIFKDKIYELVNKVYYYKSYNYFGLYKKINFNKTDQPKKILIGDFLNKKIRNCSLLPKYECNDECYWEGGIRNFFKFERCKNRDIKDLIINTYCSDLTYKTKEEMITILKLFTSVDTISYDDFYKLRLAYSNKIILGGEKIDLSILTDEELCKIFKSVLNESITDLVSEKNTQIDYFKKLGFNRFTAAVFIYMIYDSISFSYTFYEIIKRCYRFLASIYNNVIKNNKLVVALLIIICLIFYNYPYILSGKPVFNYNTPLEYTIEKQKVYKNLIKTQSLSVETDIFQEFNELVDEKNLDVDAISFLYNGRVDRDVLENLKNKIKRIEDPNYVSYYSINDKKKEYISVLPIVVDHTKKEINQRLPSVVAPQAVTQIEKERTIVSYIFDYYKILNDNYNPYYTFTKESDHVIKHEIVDVKNIKSFFDFDIILENQNDFEIYKKYYDITTIDELMNSNIKTGAYIANNFLKGFFDHLPSITLNVAVNPATGEKVLLNQYDILYALKSLNIDKVNINAIYMKENETFNDLFNNMNSYLHDYVYVPQ